MRSRKAKKAPLTHTTRLPKLAAKPKMKADTPVPERGLDPEALLKKSLRERAVVDGRARGMTYRQIALDLEIDEADAVRIFQRAIGDYCADNKEKVERALGLIRARYERVTRTLMPRACGGIKTEKDADGNKREIEVPPDYEAMRLQLRAMRDEGMLLGAAKPINIEHTGKDGGAIVNEIHVGPTEAARAVREFFGDKVAKRTNGAGHPPS